LYKFKLDMLEIIWKKNTTILLLDWKITIFDHEGVKTVKVIWNLSIIFSHVKFEIEVTKKIWGKRALHVWLQSIYNLSKSTLITFLNEFLMWFFLQELVYLRGSFPRAFNTTQSQDCNGHLCTKSWIEKS